jgi:bifunctional UDP-N-acetylglucosamine pyrophosphorylase/glucosamine-1-phosphate N-acetyltransferase
MSETRAIIMAAGESTRMKTSTPKVLHEVCGRPMLAYVLDACRKASARKIYVVVGYGADLVRDRFEAGDVVWVEQPSQKGTAHAVNCCREELAGFDGDVFVLCGDGPLIRGEVLDQLSRTHRSQNAAATLATAELDDAAGYGRIIRDSDGGIKAIVEDRDCTPQQRAIVEVNPSYYIFKSRVLFDVVERVGTDNAKGEYYLTDAIGLIIAGGHKVAAVKAVGREEAVGINDRRQLSEAGKIMQGRIQQALMAAGVTITAPDNTWIGFGARIGADTVIEPFTYIGTRAKIGSGCRVGPFGFLAEGAVVADGCRVGPALRPTGVET